MSDSTISALSPSTSSPRVAASSSTYSALAKQVRAAGLLQRRVGYYLRLISILGIGAIVLAAAFVMIGPSWYQLIVAACLGVLLTQVAFFSHEAAHRQVFSSFRWNDRAARLTATFITGVSYLWWMNKHSRHHGNPNTVGKDPDISFDTISFLEQDAASRRGPLRVLTSVQGYAFFPLLLLEGVNLHWQSARSILTDKGADGRVTEAVLFLVRFGIYFGVLFWFLPVGMAVSFIAVQMMVFGLYMGISFAPNHKGMPIIERGRKVDFFSRQVLTSRNIRGGRTVEWFMGGLNYQVEHHLFPSMPRPNLRKARVLVRRFCQEQDVPYTETTLIHSYVIVVRYLNRVGLAARDPFACPTIQQFRPR